MTLGDLFVGQATAQVTVRPRKLAYLVQAGDWSSFRKAVRYAFTEWGGFAHPIAPVREKRRMDAGIWQLLEVLKPDVIVDFVGIDPNLATQIGVRLATTLVSEGSLQYDEPGIHCLTVIKPGSLRARTLFHAPPGASVSMEVAIGQLTTSDDLEQLWKETGALRTVPSSPIDLLDAQLDVPSPLWVTKQQIRTYRNQVLGAPVVVYTDSRPTLRRLLAFWNVRALTAGTGTHAIWFPVESFDVAGVSERLKALCLNKIHTLPDLLLTGTDVGALDLAAASVGFRLDTSGRSSIMFSSGTRDLNAAPLTYWRQLDPRQFLLDDRREGTRVATSLTVTRPTTTIHVQSPIEFNPTVTDKIRLDVDSVEAIQWPRRLAVAREILANSTWSDSGLGVVTAPSREFRIALAIPEAAQVLGQCLGELGWKWTLSDKGRYAKALLGAVPGRASVGSLSDYLCYRVVRELTSLSSKKATQVLRSTLPTTVTEQEISRAVAAVVPALVPRWLTVGELLVALSSVSTVVRKRELLSALSRLLDDRLVIRAFRFRCANCGLVSHILLDAARDRVSCGGCTTEAPLLGPSGEPELTYGLNSLVDRAADQDCLGHLPVQDWMHAQLGVLWAVPGADLTHSSGIKREIDVLGLSKTEVAVAEVKNSTNGFSDKVVSDAAALAVLLGADHLVLAATDNWEPARKDDVRSLAQQQVKVTVIGFSEMET